MPNVGPHEPVHRRLLTRAETGKDDLLPPLPPGQRSNCRLRREDRAEPLHPQQGSGDEHQIAATPTDTTGLADPEVQELPMAAISPIRKRPEPFRCRGANCRLDRLLPVSALRPGSDPHPPTSRVIERDQRR